MRGLRKLYNQDIAFQAKDWNGRDVFCDRGTAKSHVARFHTDAALAVDRLKTSLPHPAYVINCDAASSENAIYQLAIGDHPWLVVAIKSLWVARSKVKVAKVRLISTWYSFPEDQLQKELNKGRVIWPKASKLPSITTA